MQGSPIDLEEFAARYTAAWCSQKPASVAACYASDGWLAINGGSPAKGRSAIAQVAQSFMTAFPDLRVLLDRIAGDNDRAEYHWTLVGRNTGPGGTRHGVRISGLEIWQLDSDGLIASSNGNFDHAEYERQLQHGRE